MKKTIKDFFEGFVGVGRRRNARKPSEWQTGVDIEEDP